MRQHLSGKLVPSLIICGDDQRTTLMVQHIPIRLKYDDLVHLVKSTVGTTSFDKIILPVDANRRGCNLGYAFVNCTSIEAVLLFWQKWHGKKWSDICPNSCKVCQVKYADYQSESTAPTLTPQFAMQAPGNKSASTSAAASIK